MAATPDPAASLETAILSAIKAQILKELVTMANELADLQAAATALDATVQALQAKVAAAQALISQLRAAIAAPGIDPAAVAAVTAILNSDNAQVVAGEAALDAAVSPPAPAPAP